MRSYGDPVQVRRGADAPDQFLWRGRLYVVRDVLAHWVETGCWWRVPSAGVDREREFWRVEASCGRASVMGVYDLCFDWDGAHWLLSSAVD